MTPSRLPAANHALLPRDAWPQPAQVLLLRAALAEDAGEALAAWDEWRAAVDFEQLDYGSHRLLPLLHRNLTRHGAPTHPWLGRMKGLHRHSWVRNQRLFAGVAALLRAVRTELGVEVMLLKGAALVSQAYPDAGLRPMDDADLLVRPAEVPGVLAILADRGWQLAQGWAVTGRPSTEMTARWRRFAHAQNFVLGEPAGGPAIGVDLHWRALADSGASDALNERQWAHAIGVTLPDGTPALAPSPTDLLCQVCLHGLRYNPVPPVRWAADATLLLRTGPAFEWDRLMRFAAEHAFTRRLGAALDFLAETLHAPIPGATREQLRVQPVSEAEDKEFRMLVDGERPLYVGLGGRVGYRLHRLRSRDGAPDRRPRLTRWQDAADYFCGRWNATSALHLPLSAAQHFTRRLHRLATWKLGRQVGL